MGRRNLGRWVYTNSIYICWADATIGVSDVPSSFKWYQSLFGQPESQPHHDYFGQILDSDGTVLLCPHQWGAHEHPLLTSPDNATPGNGLLLFFRVDDFDISLKGHALSSLSSRRSRIRTRTLGLLEFARRDPDGYYVMISSLTWIELAFITKTSAVRSRPLTTLPNSNQVSNEIGWRSTLAQWRHWYWSIVRCRANSYATLASIRGGCANASRCRTLGGPKHVAQHPTGVPSAIRNY